MNFTNLIVQKLRTTMESAFMVLVTIICVGSITAQSFNAQNLDPNITGYNVGKIIDIRQGGIYSTWIQQRNQYFWQMTNGKGRNEGNYNFKSSSQTSLTLREGVRFDLLQKKVFYPNGEVGTIAFVGIRPNMSQGEVDEKKRMLETYERLLAEEEREYRDAVAAEAQAAREEAQAEQEAIRAEQEAQRAEALVNQAIDSRTAEYEEQQAMREEQQAIRAEQEAQREEQRAAEAERVAIEKDNLLEKVAQSLLGSYGKRSKGKRRSTKKRRIKSKISKKLGHISRKVTAKRRTLKARKFRRKRK